MSFPAFRGVSPCSDLGQRHDWRLLALPLSAKTKQQTAVVVGCVCPLHILPPRPEWATVSCATDELSRSTLAAVWQAYQLLMQKSSRNQTDHPTARIQIVKAAKNYGRCRTQSACTNRFHESDTGVLRYATFTPSEVFVSGDDMNARKPWEDIAERVCHEQDSQKLTELTKELIEALDVDTKQRRPELDEKPPRRMSA